MITTVKGLVLSETPVGDYDKYMTVLTENGKLSVYGNGVKRLKNPNFVATQLYAYSELTLSERGGKYYVRESSLIESFYGMRSSIEGIALAGYIAEVAADIALEGEGSPQLLRLVLNCFYLISEKKKPLMQIKAVFELRAASDAGFAPDLVACNGCGKHNLSVYFFDAEGGYFLCEDCFGKSHEEFETALRRQSEAEGIYAETRLILILSPDVYVAMRYVVYSKPERVFAFELRGDALEQFSSVCEKYLICHMEKNYRTLDFFKSVM